MPNDENGTVTSLELPPEAVKEEKKLTEFLEKGAYNQVQGRALVMAEYLLLLRDMSNALEEAKRELDLTKPGDGLAPRQGRQSDDRLSKIERVCAIIAQKAKTLKDVANYQESVIYKHRDDASKPKAVPMPASPGPAALGTARGGLAGTFSGKKAE